MSGLQSAVVFAVFLGVVVTVHELGHFLAAKWAGVKVLKFSIGFGPQLIRLRRGETDYQVAALPLGGFVQMYGAIPGEDIDPKDVHRSLMAAPWWKRFIIYAAGPAFNLAFPLLAFFFVLLGDAQAIAPRVGWAEPGLPAAQAGLQVGDRILLVKDKPIVSFGDISEALEGLYDVPVDITVERHGQRVVIPVTPRLNVDDSNPLERVKRGYIGIAAEARPPVVGVPPGSEAEKAGFQPFDRILTVDGQPVQDEVQLLKLLEGREGLLTVVVARPNVRTLAGVELAAPTVHTLTVRRQPGDGFQALGAEAGDLTLWAVRPGSAAAKAGLQAQDRIVSINGKEARSGSTVLLMVREQELKPFRLAYRRGAEVREVTLQVEPRQEYDDLKNKREVLDLGLRFRGGLSGRLDAFSQVGPRETVTITRGPVEAMQESVRQVPRAVRLIATAMARLVTGSLSAENLGGPIAVYQVATQSAEAGLDSFIQTMGVVSINLGLFNLLPVPILDGFGLLAALWEGIRRRPIPEKAREVANYVGLAVVGTLVVFVFWNDITRYYFR